MGKMKTETIHLRKQEKSQINKLNYHVKELEKEQTKLKVSRRMETVKIRDKKKKKTREPLYPERKRQWNKEFFFLKRKLLSLYIGSLRKDRGPK